MCSSRILLLSDEKKPGFPAMMGGTPLKIYEEESHEKKHYENSSSCNRDDVVARLSFRLRQR